MPVSSKLTDQTQRWEFIDIADLLPAVRLSDREEESEKLLQKRPCCVTDKWSWLHRFETYVSVLGSFYPQPIPELMAYMSLIICCSQDYEAFHGYVMIYHFSIRQQHRETETGQKLTAHCIQFVSLGNHRGAHNVSYAWQNRTQ